jgi:hypothetical protein
VPAKHHSACDSARTELHSQSEQTAPSAGLGDRAREEQGLGSPPVPSLLAVDLGQLLACRIPEFSHLQRGIDN